MFMSTMCASCQMMVDPINLLIASELYRGRVVVILRADDHACQAFLKVFPLHVPVVQDRDGLITQGFEVHHNPFGLLYDTKGILIGKGVIARNEELLALVGEKVESSKESSPR